MQLKIFPRLQQIIEYSFYLLFFIVPFIFFSGTSEVFELNKMHATYLLTTVIVGFWSVKSILSGKLIFKRTFLDIPLVLFLVSQFLSFSVSIDPHMSLWGYYSRQNGGLISLICYALLYWAYVSNMDRKSALLSIRYLLTSAAIISIWAILERLGRSPSCIFLQEKFNVDCWVQKVQERPFATLGQPNWLASWLVGIAPLSWVLLSKFKIQNVVPAILIAAAIYVTKSDAGYLGLGAAIGIFLLQFLPKGKEVKHIILYSAIILAVIFGSLFAWNKYFKDCFSFNFQRNIQEGTSSCQIRSVVWKGSIDIWKAYPHFGSGVETFTISYYKFRPIEHNQTSEWNNLYNKAHNEFLHYLATTGVIGLGTYLLFITTPFVYLFRSIKQKKENSIHNTAILACLAGLHITHFFGFSVVTTNTLLFLLPAIAVTLSSSKEELSFSHKKLKLGQYVLLLFSILTTLYLILNTLTYWYADTLYAKANSYIKRSWYAQAIQKAQQAVRLRSNEPLYLDKLAQAISYAAVDEYNKDNLQEAKRLAEFADISSEEAVRISPRYLTIIKSRAVVLNRLSQIDSIYLQKALPELQKAVEAAPTEPEVHYNLAALYSTLDQDLQSVEVLEKTVTLKPDYYDGRVGLGEAYTKIGEIEKAREQYQWVLDNLNPEDQEVKNALEQLQNSASQ